MHFFIYLSHLCYSVIFIIFFMHVSCYNSLVILFLLLLQRSHLIF